MSDFVDYGSNITINFLTKDGLKKMEPGQTYDQNLNRKMSLPDKNYVNDIIDNETFEYTFEDYSDFREIDNPYFHELRIKYLEALKNLKDYLK